MIGQNTCIEENTFIQDSIIGDNVKIGKNCSIVGSYIWDNCTIEDGCEIIKSILAEDVILRPCAKLSRGVVLGPRVIIGNNMHVPEFSKFASIPQPQGNLGSESESSESEHTMDESDSSPKSGEHPRHHGESQYGKGCASCSAVWMLIMASQLALMGEAISGKKLMRSQTLMETLISVI